MALEYPLKAHTDSLRGFKNHGDSITTPNQHFWFTQVKQESLCKWFPLPRTRERLTDSIKTTISLVLESFEPRFIVYKTVSKQTLQKWFTLEIRKSVGSACIDICIPPGGPCLPLGNINYYFSVTLLSQWSIIFV